MRIILATFPDRQEVFSSLKPFYDKYPELAEHRNRINQQFSRKKLNLYETIEFTVQRLTVNQ